MSFDGYVWLGNASMEHGALKGQRSGASWEAKVGSVSNMQEGVGHLQAPGHGVQGCCYYCQCQSSSLPGVPSWKASACEGVSRFEGTEVF